MSAVRALCSAATSSRRCGRGPVAALAALALVLAPAAADAQVGGSARATALGGGYIGLARGFETLDWNPANLALLDMPEWSLGIVQPTVSAGVGGLEFDDFTLLFEDEVTLDEETRFLSELGPRGLDMAGRGAVQGVGFSAGRLAVSASVVGLADVDASSELLELYLDTRRLGDIDLEKIGRYRTGDTAFRDALYYTVALGFGVALDQSTDVQFPLSLGVTGRYYGGIELQRARFFEPRVDIATQDFTLPIAAVRSGGGSGFGLDLGLAAEPSPGFILGIAVENLIQGMEWDEELEVRFAELTGTELADTDVDEFTDRLAAEPLDRDGLPLEALVLLREAEEAGGFFAEAFPPRIVRLGASVETRFVNVGVTYSYTHDEGTMHPGWPRYLGGGVELDVLFLELRGGAATSFDDGTLLSAGVGLDLGPVRIDAAAARLDGDEQRAAGLDDALFPDRFRDSDGWTASLGLSLVPGS